MPLALGMMAICTAQRTAVTEMFAKNIEAQSPLPFLLYWLQVPG
jgi:hypothetical protein